MICESIVLIRTEIAPGCNVECSRSISYVLTEIALDPISLVINAAEFPPSMNTISMQ